MKNGYYYPNFSFEKKTRAFNPYLGCPVLMISLFTVGVIGSALHRLIAYLADLKSTVIMEYGTFAIPLVILVFVVIMITKGVSWVLSLLTSYKFEGDKLIRGRNVYSGPVETVDMVVQTVNMGMMISNLKNLTMVNLGNSISNYIELFRRIRLNCNYEYVQKCFDTDYYKKKEFTNPRLVKETKYFLVYGTDTKKIKIPKIYPGLCVDPNVMPKKLSGRIAVRAIIIFLIAMTLSFADLCAASFMNSTYKGNVAGTLKQISEVFSEYGYTPHEFLDNAFVRNEGERKSEVKYTIYKDGQIREVDVEVYLLGHSKNKGDEIRYIIGTINHEFDEVEVSGFLEALNLSLDGEFTYYKLISTDGKYTLIISLSGGYVHVHTY